MGQIRRQNIFKAVIGDALAERLYNRFFNRRWQGEKFRLKSRDTQFAERCWKQLCGDEPVGKRLLDFGSNPEEMLQSQTVELYPIRKSDHSEAGGARKFVFDSITLNLYGMAVVFVAVIFNDSSDAAEAACHIPPLPRAGHANLAAQPICKQKLLQCLRKLLLGEVPLNRNYEPGHNVFRV
jgi:hypothetical protein